MGIWQGNYLSHKLQYVPKLRQLIIVSEQDMAKLISLQMAIPTAALRLISILGLLLAGEQCLHEVHVDELKQPSPEELTQDLGPPKTYALHPFSDSSSYVFGTLFITFLISPAPIVKLKCTFFYVISKES